MDNTVLLNQVIAKQDLTETQAKTLLEHIISGALSPVQIAAFLTAFRMKGESVDEIVGFVTAMRDHMTRVNIPGAIDIVGTGGDGTGIFNISTTVSFVLAGAGVTVAKHGNRAASSQSGSADVLETLGVLIHLTPEQAEAVAKKVRMVFLFAPLYHQAMKNVGVVRKELKTRTIFNVLGPFANPAGVKRQITGVPSVEIAEKLAHVGLKLGYEHLLIVTSNDGMDEISISAKTNGFEVKNGKIRKISIDPTTHGFKKGAMEDVLGGNAQENAAIITDILAGKTGPKRDIVILNAAYALLISGSVKTVKEGICLAEESIDTGRAKEVLENLRTETQKYV